MERTLRNMCRRISFSLGILGIYLCSIPLMAQQDSVKATDLIKLDLQQLIDFQVSSASKINLKINESPSIVSVSSRNNNQKFQWITLNDIAARQAGYTLGQDRFNRTIVSRGISDLLWSKRLLVLFDGVPFSSFQSSVSDEAFALNMAKSVEMIRGPGAVLYGTQSITGVVAVNSLSPNDLIGNGHVEVKAGDYGTSNLDVLVGNKGRWFNTLISFNHFTTQGNEYFSYDALLKKDSDGNYIKYKTQDNTSTSHFYTKLEGKDALEGLSLSYHLQDYNFQMGHGFLTVYPDIETSSRVTRNYIMARYNTPKSKSSRLNKEFILKYDHETSEMNMQIIPNGFVRPYVAGVDSSGAPIVALDSAHIWEQYKTPVNNLFARAQWIYFLNNKVTILGGIEQDMVLYKGDKTHYSNIDLNNPGFVPFANGKIESIQPLYERILNKPINNTGIYTQLTTGKLLGQDLTATIGARYDMYYYDYTNLSTGTNEHRFVNHISPRFTLVYQPKQNFTLRAMYGNAFRVASPFEQFISNSIITGTNQTNIKPEEINTYEFTADWSLSRKWNIRNTYFYSSFLNQIRSSGGIFTNVLNTTQHGVETELQYRSKKIIGFANYSYVQRLSEESTDPTIAISNSLIYYPNHSANIGVVYTAKKFEYTIQSHFQSSVDRRSTEKGIVTSGSNMGVNMDELRGAKVDAWTLFDANILWFINYKLQARFIVNNVFNKKYAFVNNLNGLTPQPFDYQQAGRRIMLSVKLFL